MKKWADKAHKLLKGFFTRHWIGTVVILISTLIFFAPLLPRLNNYSEGGDAMFNAWVLARNHNCILHQGCPDYTDGNIYFPNEDTMLYSENQLTAGLLTLPLKIISDNPVFYFNVFMIIGFFLNGWFMYLLAKRLSGGNEPYSILAALVWEFAPHKAITLGHLQLVGTFFLPLALLLIIKYLDTRRKLYAALLFITLTLLFYSSWYLMVFGFVVIAVTLGGTLLTKIAKFKDLRLLFLATALALAATLPLIMQYVRFSKEHDANFTIGAQAYYSSSIADYIMPYQNTIEGKVYDKVAPSGARRIPYSADGNSYHGVALYTIAAVIIFALIFKRRNKILKPHRQWLIVWALVGLVGFIASLGPLLKIGGSYIYATLDSGIGLVVPLPYILLDFAFPQIMFIRAVERWSVLVLLALSIMIAYLPLLINKHKTLKKNFKLVFGLIVAFCVFEIMPASLYHISPNTRSDTMHIPAAYTFIKENRDVDNLIILGSDEEYEGNVGLSMARQEPVLWAGYHNKKIFNGYSGYEPPNYKEEMAEFRTLSRSSIEKMKAHNLRYILIDKELLSSDPDFINRAQLQFGEPSYKDDRYELFKL